MSGLVWRGRRMARAAMVSSAVVLVGLFVPGASSAGASTSLPADSDSSYTDPYVDAGTPSAANDSNTGSYTADQVTSGGTDEGNPYALLARNDWLTGIFGTSRPSGVSGRLLQELQNQQTRYPLQVAGAQPAPGLPAWRSVGPTRDVRNFNGNKLTVTDSGRLQAILPHSSDADTVYVLAAGGGVWKTTNFTRPYPTWVPKTDGVFTTSGGALALGGDPNTLYLGLGDPFNGQPLAGGAMLRSTDGGDTWTPAPFIGLPGAGMVVEIKVDTSQPQDTVLVGTDNGLFRSTDGGLTYSAVAGIPAGSVVWSLAHTSAGWLASSEAGCGAGCAGFGPSSLFLSIDRGASWQPIGNSGGGYSGAGRTTLAIGSTGDSVVYAFAATPDGFRQADLFRSVDGGQTWTPLNLSSRAPANPNPDQPDMNLMGGQAWYNQLVLIDPSDASRNTVYLAGMLSSAKSTDGGQTWTLLTNWRAQFGLTYAHADFHAAAFSSLGPSPTIFFGDDGGLAITTDGGATFSTDKNQGLVDTQDYSVTTDPTHPDSILTGLQDLGTRARQGSTSTFNGTLGGDGFGAAWSQANGDLAMGSVYFDRLFTSSNPGQPNWEPHTSGINLGDASFFTALTSPSPVADPTGQVFYTTSLHHVYKTDNGGRYWNSILNLRGGFIRPTLNPVSVSPLATNHVAAVGNAGAIFVTADGGRHWTASHINGQVPGWLGFNSTVAWGNNSVLYAASASPFPHPRVAKSSDGGAHWVAAAAGLPDVPINHLLASPADPTGNTVYAATFLGIYQTTDGGQNWQLFGSGLPAVQVFSLYLSPDGGLLRAATFGRGIWETGQATQLSPATPRSPQTFKVPGDFPTVQAAVDAAAAGDTIALAPGTYAEQVTISKDLNLRGASSGTSTIKAPSALHFGPVAGRRSILTILNAANVDISDVYITGPGTEPCNSPTSLQEGVLIVQNAALTMSSGGITDMHAGSISGSCSLSGRSTSGVRAGLRNGGVDGRPLSGRLTMTGVSVSGYTGDGIVVRGFGSTGAITRNRITGPGSGTLALPNGVEVLAGAIATLSDNTISNNLCDLPAICGPDPIGQVQSAGILVASRPGTAITHNQLTNNDIGTYLIFAGGCCSDSGNTLTNNRYFGAAIQDGDNALSNDSIVGGQVGVAVVADSEDTTGTLHNVSIQQTSVAPTQTISCCGFTAHLVGS